MDAVRLAVRGLRWRAGSSLAVLVVAVIATAGAALGPLYARSAEESLVREGLAQQQAVTTGVQVRGNVAGQTQFSPAQVAAAVAARAADPALDPWYLPATLSLSVGNGSPSYDGKELGIAQVSWYRGMCGGITVVSGRCPDAPGEAMISTRTSAVAAVPLGATIQLGITSDPIPDRATVVGTYDPTTADPAVWGLESPGQFAPGRIEGSPDRLDEVLVSEATMLRSNGDVGAVSLRALDASRVLLSDLPALRAAVVAATAIDAAPTTEVRTVSVSALPEYLDSLQPQLEAVAAASFAVTAQLVLLAWFVLFLVVSATSEERSGEVALAKLRGMSPRATLWFGLSEPLLLLLLSLPIGLAIAYLADLVLTSRFLSPGTTVTLEPAVLLALALCFLGGAAAAGLAARSILTAPVLDQLRRTGGRRARLARSAAVDGIAVALAAAGVYELTRGGSDALALIAPGLVALAAGLLAVRVLPRVARVEVSRTRGSVRLASFLASRNIARRPSGLRIVVLLSLAVGLAVFAVDGWVVASANRADLARAEVGSAQVLHVRAPSIGDLIRAVSTADPDGTTALAAVGVDSGTGGLLAVDSRRLAAVSAWDPAWVGLTPEQVGPVLHPDQPARPLLVRDRLSFTVDFSQTAELGLAGLRVAVRSASGIPLTYPLGTLTTGSRDYAIDLPPCRVEACALTAFVFEHPFAVPMGAVTADVTIRGARDGAGVVDLAAPGTQGWRSGATGARAPIPPGAAEPTRVSDGSIDVALELQVGDDGAIEVADHPSVLPVVQGSDVVNQSGSDNPVPVISGLDGQYIPVDVRGTGVLPRLLRSGSLADLSYAVGLMGTAPSPLDYQVWLAPDAPSAIVASLASSGVEVTSTESIAEREAQLGRSGSALSLRLFLLAALVALVLGAGTLLANAYVVIRRRSYELAALRALGASQRSLVRAARREQLILATTGLVLGATSGLVAAAFALPALLASAGESGPPQWYGPAWLPVLVLLGIVLVLLAVVADVGARRTVHRALPELLRQVQE